MKRVLGHCLAGLTFITGGVAVMSACAHDDSSLFVQNVLAPTPVTAGQTCTYTNDPNQTFESGGTLDLDFRTEYYATFLLGNQLVSQANAQQLQTETSTINIQGAIVRNTDAAGNQLDSFTSLTSGTVYPGSGTVPGYTPIGAVIASQTATSKLANEKAAELANSGSTTLVSYVKFYGYTLGGTYVESNDFEFPINLCQGCLIGFNLSEATECCVNGSCVTPRTPNCLSPGSSSSSLPVPCNPGEDTAIDCSQCQEYGVCRGAYAAGGVPALCEPDGGTNG